MMGTHNNTEGSYEIWALIEYESANDIKQQHAKQFTQHPLLPTTQTMAMLHKQISTLGCICCDIREPLTSSLYLLSSDQSQKDRDDAKKTVPKCKKQPDVTVCALHTNIAQTIRM